MSKQECTENQIRKKRRALLTKLREACIFSVPALILSRDRSCPVLPLKVTEDAPRDLGLVRSILLHSEEKLESNLSALLIEAGAELFRIPLENLVSIDENRYSAQFILNNAELANRRSKERKKERISYFAPILLYPQNDGLYPIPGYGRLVDSDDKALCFSVQFFSEVTVDDFENAKVVFLNGPIATKGSMQKIERVRRCTHLRQGETDITKADIILTLNLVHQMKEHELATVQPSQPFTVEFECLLHERRMLRANITKLYREGFFLEPHSSEMESLPSQMQIDHAVTGLRFNSTKEEGKLFVSYNGLGLGAKTKWFNFITRYLLGFDHSFTPNDSKQIIHLMFESGNYTSHAMLQLSLMNDYFQHMWPAEQSFSATKYRWLVRDRRSEYIGHTAGIRVSQTLWAAIDNIGSQSYMGSWNSEFVAKWTRSFMELLTNVSETAFVQWTFAPSAGVWAEFDRMLSQQKGLVVTRDRFWGVFLLNRKRDSRIQRRQFASHPCEVSLQEVVRLFQRRSESEQKLIELLSDGLLESSSFQIDFEREYGFQLRRFYYVIESKKYGRFLLTFSNYPAWSTLHRGHNWDYLFPLDETVEIDRQDEEELFRIIEETILRSGCSPYRLAIVSPVIQLSVGHESTNLSLLPAALELAAKSLEKL